VEFAVGNTLVTGGAGFIGSHLCERLLALGESVICMDNFSSGSEENVEHFKSSLSFRLVTHDVIEPFDAEVDRVYNLACPASSLFYQIDPVHTLKTNVLGALYALKLAARRGARILQASTSEVYLWRPLRQSPTRVLLGQRQFVRGESLL
jgi:UDP-glucuronate decarboxylase